MALIGNPARIRRVKVPPRQLVAVGYLHLTKIASASAGHRPFEAGDDDRQHSDTEQYANQQTGNHGNRQTYHHHQHHHHRLLLR